MSNQCNISSHAGFSGFRFSSTADSRDNDARETTEAMLRTCARRVASRVTVRSRRDERTRRANATSDAGRIGIDWNAFERRIFCRSCVDACASAADARRNESESMTMH